MFVPTLASACTLESAIHWYGLGLFKKSIKLTPTYHFIPLGITKVLNHTDVKEIYKVQLLSSMKHFISLFLNTRLWV